MKQYIFGLICPVILTGCATTHSGEMAKSDANNEDIVISIERNGDLSDKYYIFYKYTIENKSKAWKQVQIIDVDFDTQESEILTDEKLTAWIEGAELKFKASQFNQSLLLGSMAAVGGVVPLTSNGQRSLIACLCTLKNCTGVMGPHENLNPWPPFANPINF